MSGDDTGQHKDGAASAIEAALDRLRQNERAAAHHRSEARVCLVAMIGVALLSWELGFQIGAFKLIFFDKLFSAWVFATASFFALAYIGKRYPRLGIIGYGIMFFPSLYLLLIWLQNSAFFQWEAEILFVMHLLVLVVCMPYTFYRVLWIMHPEIMEAMTLRFLGVVAAFALAVGLAGFLVGHYNYLFLSCEDFQRSGNYQPKNCRSQDFPFGGSLFVGPL